MQTGSSPGIVDKSSGMNSWKDGIDAYESGSCEDNSKDTEQEDLIRFASTHAPEYGNNEECPRKDLPFSLLSSSILKLVSREPVIGHGEKEVGSSLKLSTNQLLRLAGQSFINQKASNELVDDGNSLADMMTTEDKRDVELTLHLLAAAEKISEKQYDEAIKLIATHRGQGHATKTGTPVQRLAHYFGEALEERIETGKETAIMMENKLKLEEKTVCSKWKYNCAILSFYQQLPFIQSIQYAAIQAILESIKTKQKVHIIDIHVRTGVLWAVLINAIATKQEICPIEYLKITALETTDDRKSLELIGRHLKSLSNRALDTGHFSFHIMSLSEFMEEECMLEAGCEEEAVVVYAPFALRAGIGKPGCLEKFMKSVRRMNPTLMVVTEMEANHNSPSFANRFIEALFYFGAVFDSLEDRMSREDQRRIDLEEISFCSDIRSILAAGDRERVSRCVKFEVWRAFFVRFGLVEKELSESSLYQASLVVQSFKTGNSCTLEMEGNGRNCLVVGWKGTPLFSLSIWRLD